MITGPCWRCELPGHAAAECDRPPPGTAKERDARIDRYVERWIAKEITPEQKRAWIAMENKALERGRAN